MSHGNDGLAKIRCEGCGVDALPLAVVIRIDCCGEWCSVCTEMFDSVDNEPHWAVFLTGVGRGSCFWFADNWRKRRKSSLPDGNNHGSLLPSEANACPTAQRAPSTVHEQT